MSQIITSLSQRKNLLDSVASRAPGSSAASDGGATSCAFADQSLTKSCNVDDECLGDQNAQESTAIAYNVEDIPVMVSGAGHDAMALAEVAKVCVMQWL
jgi:hypothetical protein